MILRLHFRTIFIAFVLKLKKIFRFTCIKKLNHFKWQRIAFNKASKSMISTVNEKWYEIVSWWLKNSKNEHLITIRSRWVIINSNQMSISMFFNVSSFFFTFTNHDNNIRRMNYVNSTLSWNNENNVMRTFSRLQMMFVHDQLKFLTSFLMYIWSIIWWIKLFDVKSQLIICFHQNDKWWCMLKKMMIQLLISSSFKDKMSWIMLTSCLNEINCEMF
jgi:hypothetical protein